MSCDLNTTKAARKDICYYAGNEIDYSFWVYDQDGLPVNLSGVECEMQVKYKPEDPLTRAIITFKTTDGTMTVTGVDSNFITLKGVYQVPAGLRYHDLLRKDIPEYIMAGRFNIVSNVTRT